MLKDYFLIKIKMLRTFCQIISVFKLKSYNVIACRESYGSYTLFSLELFCVKVFAVGWGISSSHSFGQFRDWSLISVSHCVFSFSLFFQFLTVFLVSHCVLMLLQVTSSYYRLLQVTTGYFRLLHVANVFYKWPQIQQFTARYSLRAGLG